MFQEEKVQNKMQHICGIYRFVYKEDILIYDMVIAVSV